jgi:hypothetical protein
MEKFIMTSRFKLISVQGPRSSLLINISFIIFFVSQNSHNTMVQDKINNLSRNSQLCLKDISYDCRMAG